MSEATTEPQATPAPRSPRMSPEIGELALALALAQGEFEPVVKDNAADIASSKGSYKYKYADLGSCIESVRKPLAKHGLAVVQLTVPVGPDIIMRTMLTHKSGQWLASDFPLPIGANDWARPQSIGSILTYFRRYTLCALLQIAQEDDDAQEAMRGGDARRPAPRPEPRPTASTSPRSDPPFEPRSSRPSGNAADAIADQARGQRPPRSSQPLLDSNGPGY